MTFNRFDRAYIRVRTSALVHWERMTGPRRDMGMETLEKLILGAVVLGVAVTFGTVFKSTSGTLMDRFKSAVGL
ncbi:hypothetical protein [Streptomyces flavofungini]|uniref:Integral membrane protein n=1 Tax=Streptomyces flavofungini TaxID=68200 RepID=A0ABS0XGK3_9ACTN|nr:hypothetical protein [Streptomyces flavofungini]MBJ3812358.1 hypothetical protein [Streptomyces flavofungini]GHC88248.1 hypothetical protein GCM10010349_75360 [Streptomyces flavofungini]